MAINFPSSPSVNQIYTYQSRSWQWDGNAWLQVRTGVASVGNEVPGGSKNGVNTVFTTAAPFISGTLRVYLNGQRLTETEDYTVGTSSITMLTAPLATDILLVDYYTHTGEIATGSASTITNEVPSGSVDGVNKVFTCAHAFVSGTLQVFRDGQLLKGVGMITPRPIQLQEHSRLLPLLFQERPC